MDTSDRLFPSDGSEELPAVIKLDAEGSELPALEGCRGILEGKRPLLVIELNEVTARAFGYSVMDLLRFLWDRGYEVTLIQRDDLIAFTPDSVPNDFFANAFVFPRERVRQIRETLRGSFRLRVDPSRTAEKPR